MTALREAMLLLASQRITYKLTSKHLLYDDEIAEQLWRALTEADRLIECQKHSLRPNLQVILMLLEALLIRLGDHEAVMRCDSMLNLLQINTLAMLEELAHRLEARVDAQ